MRRSFILGLAVILLLGSCGKDRNDDSAEAPTTARNTLSFYDAAPPWPLAGDQADRMRAAGVPLLKAEGRQVHYHAHLDVFYDGKRVTVPANIGIDFDESVISPLHTHASSGVIHVEAESDEDFTLGQFLTEWGVKSSGGCVADKCGDEVAVFVNGSIKDDAAAALVIPPHSEIALILGTAPPDIPSGYDCQAENPGDIPCS